mmetsp:Transcript_25510/g.35072  ORF Transcript_25510/g.35072 Transcript_25510/m.35072 type:complete len:199 (-) Transcript_25510:154-750(-)
MHDEEDTLTLQPWGYDPVGMDKLEIDESPTQRRNPHTRRTFQGIMVTMAVFSFALIAVYVLSSGTIVTERIAVRCVDNSACQSGLVGDCCPTSDGIMLGCCDADTNIVSRHLTAKGACDDNSACAALGMSGLCCPTSEGVDLSCCQASSNEISIPHSISAVCSSNKACEANGLSAENCCPTDDGVFLSCCPPENPPRN